ncbi:MAG: hypothetical protein HY329_27065 [Chloroflexi bacterium]|nr:hypothetical protein [Chloroflexota bacterium]
MGSNVRDRTSDSGRVTNTTNNVGATMIALAGFGMIGYAVAFIIRSFTHLIELGFTVDDVGVTREEIWAFSPGLHNYISHLQVNLGAFIAASGLAFALMAWFGIRRREPWAWWGAVLTTILWVVVAFPIHYVYGLGTLAHLGFGYLAVALLALGACLAHPWQ